MLNPKSTNRSSSSECSGSGITRAFSSRKAVLATFSKNRDRLLVLGGAKTCLTYPGPLQKNFSLV
jgi:hypothetical protein